MFESKIARRLTTLILLGCAALLNGCQTPAPTSFDHNIPPLEHAMINAINQDGPGERYVINRVQLYDEMVDWFTISLTHGTEYTASSESGSGRVGKGGIVQFCGWGEFLGIPIYTDYPYLCRRGQGLIFGVTDHGWVHLYGAGEVGGKRIKLAKPNY
jgi:hypothetical protein